MAQLKLLRQQVAQSPGRSVRSWGARANRPHFVGGEGRTSPGNQGSPRGRDRAPLGVGPYPERLTVVGRFPSVSPWGADSPGGRRRRLDPGVPRVPSSCASSRLDVGTTSHLSWPCPASSPGAYCRARALAEHRAPRWRPATADPVPSSPGVPVLLPPRPLGAAAPECNRQTCRARRIETTTPGRHCAGARARRRTACGEVDGAAD